MWSGATARAQGIPVRLAAGASHGVLLKADGSVWTWGANGDGQLGTAGDHAWAPARVPGLDGIRGIAAGDRFTAAVKNDGTVWAWGENGSSRPAPVAGLAGVVAVAAGGRHALALRSDGTVWTWGGDPALGQATLPAPVAGLTGVAAIAAADKHSVALESDGTVWVWGDHGAGDLGNGTYGLSSVPLQLRGLSDATAVAAGQELTVALKKDGTVWAVGYGAAGQLGNGSTENSTRPVMVSGLAGVKALAAGVMHVLALKNDGTVWSWGYNHDGQLGNPRVGAEQSAKPVRAGTLSGVVAIAAASNHSAAVTAQGIVWAWGQNEDGALGADDETLAHSDVPMRVGQAVPAECQPLFSCQTGRGKFIRICGQQDPANIARWTAIQYRFGTENGPPELVFPADPSKGSPSLFFSHEESNGDYRVSIRFSSGAFTYRVFSGSKSGAGVQVADAMGKKRSTLDCAESPAIFPEYLRLSLPCDPQNPHGAAACKKDPYPGK